MATKEEVIDWAKDLANQGIGVDADGAFGTQCVDLPNYISIHFFGRSLSGNAIDLLNSAISLNYPVVYDAPGVNPQAGAIFVMDTTELYGHPYGHTGLVIEDSDGYTLKTIEQNIDGNADSLEVGGPARYNERDFSGIVGWFYFPYDDSMPNDTESSFDNIHPEEGIFTIEVDSLNVRSTPSLSSDIVATYHQGNEICYDGWCDAEGYIWITYVAVSGERRYVATGESENGQRISNFGTFS